MYRLAELDADSAGLVRVIDYFDALIRHGADIPAMLRAGAALAGCVVGIDISGWQGQPHASTRCGPNGQWAPQPVHRRSSENDVIVDDGAVGTVWIERNGTALPLDDMLVERMALTAAIILQPARKLTVAEHTHNLLFPMDDAAVQTSCAALEIAPTCSVRVVATGATVPTRVPRLIMAGRSTPIEVAGHHFFLIMGGAAESVAGTAQVGISLSAPASEAHRYLDNARFARSQASDREPLVVADQLGALNLLGASEALPHNRIPDLERAGELTRTVSGNELLDTLRVYLRSGTLRAAAGKLHLHHSSVALRLAKLSEHLGYAVDSIEHRARATAMMMMIDGAVRD